MTGAPNHMPNASEHAIHLGVAGYLRMLVSQRHLKFAWHHPANGEARDKRTAGKLKVYGVTAGQPDLEIFLPGEKTIFIELKAHGNYLEPAQKERHELLKSLGFSVYTVKDKTVQGAQDQVMRILLSHGVEGARI